MPEESVQKNGAKAVLLIALIVIVLGGLLVIGYATNEYKRGSMSPMNTSAETSATNSAVNR